MLTVKDFESKMRVRYIGQRQNARGFPYNGQLATVIAPIKSRKVVHIKWDMADEPSFEANPSNLEILLDNPPIVSHIIEVNP